MVSSKNKNIHILYSAYHEIKFYDSILNISTAPITTKYFFMKKTLLVVLLKVDKYN